MQNHKDRSVLVITDKQDAHLPFVRRWLGDRLQVLDPLALLTDDRLSFGCSGTSTTVTWNNRLLDNISGVWYRKPGEIYGDQVSVAADFKDYSAAALRALVMQLHTAFTDAVWISDYFAMQRASNKTWQLQQAARLGFHTPATLMTSDLHAAKRFIKRHEQVIVKPLSNVLPVVDGEAKMFFASRVYSSAMPDLHNLHLAPVIFQQAIEAVCDIRVTVVGDTVFAAAIHTTGRGDNARVRDWRIGQLDDSLRIKPYQLPAKVLDQCVQLVKNLGLQYGAIDLVQDKEGKLWFLENNANGQWAFVEKHTGQPISKAIAALLTK